LFLRGHVASSLRGAESETETLSEKGLRKSARQPQESVSRDPIDYKQVILNQWLGGRDSNPDTQIQSSFDHSPNQRVQRLSTAKHGKLRQNPQGSRNEDCPQFEQSENQHAGIRATFSDPVDQPRHHIALNGFDFEEDTLP
jgi:hypothetical protein